MVPLTRDSTNGTSHGRNSSDIILSFALVVILRALYGAMKCIKSTTFSAFLNPRSSRRSVREVASISFPQKSILLFSEKTKGQLSYGRELFIATSTLFL